MTPPRPWRRLGTRTLVQDRWIHLRADAWKLPDGQVLDTWYMQERPDWVHTVALTTDGRLVLVRQFRPGAEALTLELPGGVMEPEEADPVAAARREFQEETGYDAPTWRLVTSLVPEPAHATNRLHIVLAEGAAPAGPQRLDSTEEIAVELHAVEALLPRLGAGVVCNAGHVGGLLLALRMAGRIAF